MAGKILCVGLHTIDIQFLVDHFPEANKKQKAKYNEIFVGGPATNAAITASFLGSQVELLTPIGKNTLSDYIKNELLTHKVILHDPIPEKATAPIFASIVTSENSGERSIVSYHPPLLPIENYSPENINCHYTIALFDGFFPELAIPVAKKMRQHGITTCFDGGSWKPRLEKLLEYMDIAICSDDFYPPHCKTKSDVFNYLNTKGCHETIITQGHAPLLYQQSNVIKSMDIPEVKVVDTLGAGDIFHGAFCHFYSLYNSLEEPLSKASEIAAQSCTSFGTRAWMKK